MSTIVATSLMILATGALGASLLRRAWRSKESEKRPWRWGGWLLLLAAPLEGGWQFGATRGLFVALSLVSVSALAVVAAGRQQRASRAGGKSMRSLAPEPLERPSTRWRGVLRWLLAGPIGMVAALAVGICYAVCVPGPPQTRLVIGGMIVPLVWGGAMAWTLADNHILRATAVLVGTAIVGFTISALRGLT